MDVPRKDWPERVACTFIPEISCLSFGTDAENCTISLQTEIASLVHWQNTSLSDFALIQNSLSSAKIDFPTSVGQMATSTLDQSPCCHGNAVKESFGLEDGQCLLLTWPKPVACP